MTKSDAFWNTDLDVIEATFLKVPSVTDLPVKLDDRVPVQGSVILDRTVNVDRKVEQFLKEQQAVKNKQPSLFIRLFDRLVFG